MTIPPIPMLAGLVCLLLSSCAMSSRSQAGAGSLAHDVYFTLTDNSPTACRALVDACYERLAGIPGIAYFAAGTRVPDLRRDVNEQGYDVSLHVFFADRASHDAYQAAPEHLQFIDEQRANWKSVRVFDSTVASW